MNKVTANLLLHTRLEYQGETRNPPGIKSECRREHQLCLFFLEKTPNLFTALRDEDMKMLKALEKAEVEDAKHFREWFENKEAKMKPSDTEFLSLYMDCIFAGDERAKMLTLAGRYNSGRNGVIKDKKKAEEWYQEGALWGSGKAMHNLACAKASSGKMEEAKKWVIKAIESKWQKVEKSKVLLVDIEKALVKA